MGWSRLRSAMRAIKNGRQPFPKCTLLNAHEIASDKAYMAFVATPSRHAALALQRRQMRSPKPML